MLPVLFILYAVYLILVGVNGNGSELLTEVEEEKQFIYWALVILIVMALWSTNEGSQIAKPFAFLIIVGFLLKDNHYQTIVTNAKQVLPGL